MGDGFGDGSWTCCEAGGVGLFLGLATVGLGLLGAPCCCLFCCRNLALLFLNHT